MRCCLFHLWLLAITILCTGAVTAGAEKASLAGRGVLPAVLGVTSCLLLSWNAAQTANGSRTKRRVIPFGPQRRRLHMVPWFAVLEAQAELSV